MQYNETVFSGLPIELLLQIFSFFNYKERIQLSAVSHQFLACSRDPAWWHKQYGTTYQKFMGHHTYLNSLLKQNLTEHQQIQQITESYTVEKSIFKASALFTVSVTHNQVYHLFLNHLRYITESKELAENIKLDFIDIFSSETFKQYGITYQKFMAHYTYLEGVLEQNLTEHDQIQRIIAAATKEASIFTVSALHHKSYRLLLNHVHYISTKDTLPENIKKDFLDILFDETLKRLDNTSHATEKAFLVDRLCSFGLAV